MESCTIITTEANELIREYHDRMQVILEPQECELWLDAKVEDPKLLEPLLQPFSGKEMLVCSVQTIVNNPKNGVPECIVLA